MFKSKTLCLFWSIKVLILQFSEELGMQKCLEKGIKNVYTEKYCHI